MFVFIRIHFPGWLLFLALAALAATTAARALETNALVCLTNATQVRLLSPTAAAEKVPVRLRGVVVVSLRGNQFVLVDETAGIYGEGDLPEIGRLQRGDLIQVDGFSDPGKFAPFVLVTNVQKIGRSKIPQAVTIKGDDLSSGQLDAQWIEAVGIVRRAEPTGGGFNVELSLEPERLRVLAFVPGSASGITVDSTIRLRAVCFYQFNKSRQMLQPFLSVPQGEPVQILKAGTNNPTGLEIRPIKSLMQFNAAETYANRVRVNGQVIYAHAGEGVWIHDADRGLRVFGEAKELPAVGAEVDVYGFLKRGEYGPVIEDATFKKANQKEPVKPVVLSDVRQALDHDADLVQCEAVVVEQWRALDGIRLKLINGKTEFPAVLRVNDGSLPADWQPKTRVRVTGVCTVGFLTEHTLVGTQEPQVFQILLRSPADILILERPSWWTSEHVSWVFGGVIFLLLSLVVLVVGRSRKRLREQAVERMKAEAEFAAVWNERNRMAREIHDTLAQGLTAISMQLEVLKRHLPADAKAKELLEQARSLVREKMVEARNAIWNVRSQVLEKGDLAKALGDVVRHLTEGTTTKGEIRVRGNVRRLAPNAENNLLLLGQEAITNAMKYSQAKTILVALDFEEKQLRLSVSDDGCGFDVKAPPPSEGGLGLKAMQERATLIHADFSVVSEPGEGTIISVVMSLLN